MRYDSTKWSPEPGRSGAMRMGAPWNDAESRHLYAGYVFDRQTIPALAAYHQRGVSGVSAQLNRIMADDRWAARLVQQLKENREMHNYESPRQCKSPLELTLCTCLIDVWSERSLCYTVIVGTEDKVPNLSLTFTDGVLVEAKVL